MPVRAHACHVWASACVSQGSLLCTTRLSSAVKAGEAPRSLRLSLQSSTQQSRPGPPAVRCPEHEVPRAHARRLTASAATTPCDWTCVSDQMTPIILPKPHRTLIACAPQSLRNRGNGSECVHHRECAPQRRNRRSKAMLWAFSWAAGAMPVTVTGPITCSTYSGTGRIVNHTVLATEPTTQ